MAVLHGPQVLGSGCALGGPRERATAARMAPATNMYGGSFYEAGCVDQWIEFAKNELDLPVGMWIYPILGFISSNASNTEKAKEDVKRALAKLLGEDVPKGGEAGKLDPIALN